MRRKKGTSKKLKPGHRKTIRFLGLFFLTLLFLHIAVYFGSDLLFRKYLQREVGELSAGKYAVDFDRFNLSLFERGFYLQGFTLVPLNDSLPENENQPVYSVTIPQISLRGLRYSFREDRLIIGSLNFVRPGIQSRGVEDLKDESAPSPLEMLEIEIRKSLGQGLRNIIIDNLYIEDADLLLENFISQKSITADKTNLYVKNIRLYEQKEWSTPFNAEGFSLDMQNFEMVLADSVHTVNATLINISSLDQFIRAEKVSIKPDFAQESGIYYEIDLDNLALRDADINQMFYTSDVNIGSLTLDRPSFSIFADHTAVGGTAPSEGLYPLIENILASISIDDLNIENGEFLQRSIVDPDQNRIEAEKINFHMNKVYIGPDEERSSNQFFYAQDAAVDVSEVRVALADGVHWISGEKVSLSSFEDRISMENVRIMPMLEEENPDMTLFEIEVPFVKLGNANLKKIYNESIVDIDEMIISAPSVLLRDLVANQDKNSKSTLQELTKDYLKAVYVKKLEVTEGSLVLDNNIRIRQDSLSFGNISFVLEDFRLDQELESDSTGRIFFAEDLQLEIEDYALKLSDNLHLFTADKVFIDTKKEFVGIDGFRFQPQNPQNFQSSLQNYRKTSILDIEVPDFYAWGVDISEAYFNQRLFVEEILVPSPVIKLKIFGDRVEEEAQEGQVERGDIVDLLTSYFDVVRVNMLNVEEGTLELENYLKDRVQTFAENDVSIGIKNFYVDEFIDPLDSRVLFADELDIQLNNHVFNIAEGRYSIVADGINYNSALEEINTHNVRLMPSRNLVAKAVIEARIPNMSVQGVDLEAFLFENTLSLTKLKLSGADVQLSLNTRQKESPEKLSASRRRDRNLPKTIEIIKIDTVEAEDAKFNLGYRENGHDLELINSGVNLSFYDFFLDSAILEDGDIASFFSNMSMEIDKFSLALRDSIHTVNFSKVTLDTKSEEIVFDDFTVIPNDLKGKRGLPVVDAQVPRVSLKTRSLTDLQSTGDLLVKELVLLRPEILLYMDQEQDTTSNGDKGEQLTPDFLKSLSVSDFIIRDGSLVLKDKSQAKAMNSFQNLSITLHDLHFDLAAADALNQKFYLNKDFEFELSDYEVKLPDSLNLLRIGSALLSQDNLKLHDVSLVPRYGPYAYSRKVGHQTDFAEVEVPEIILEGINVEKLLGDNTIEAKIARLSNAHALVFRDKRQPLPAEIHKGMPQELMMKGILEVKLDSLIVENAEVIYREFPEQGLVPGELLFSEMDATMSPFYVTKDPGQYPHERSQVWAEALLNGQAPMNLHAELFYQPPFPIQVKVGVGQFELPMLNSILKPNVFVSVLDGVIQGGKWQFIADENVAMGSMTICYNDLQLRLLDERTLKRGRGRKGVLTFVINNLAVRSNNPRKLFNRLVEGSIYEERDKSRFIFNYLWKATLSGLKGTAGLGQAKPPKNARD